MPTFSERHGYQESPQQLNLEEISQDFRLTLWRIVYEDMLSARKFSAGYRNSYFPSDWMAFFRTWHVKHDAVPVDEISNDFATRADAIKLLVLQQPFNVVFDFIEVLLEWENVVQVPNLVIAHAFEQHKLAYRIFDGKQIGPISSEEHAKAVEAALEQASAAPGGGIKKHLLKASSQLMAGEWADSIRESIHAVEAASRMIAPDAQTLGAALTVIDRDHGLHPALKQGFSKLYGFTSDEDGIRHAIIDDPKGPIDEATALFMHGACASFVTYLLTVCSKES